MELLSVSEAARRLSASRTTIYRAVKDGRLNAKHTGSGTVILADEKWEQFEPRKRGARVQKIKQKEGNDENDTE